MPGSTLTRPGPNDRLPHGTATARTHHLAHGEELCDTCQADDGCEGCTAALAEALRAQAATVAAMVPAGRLVVPCAACGQTRAYVLSEAGVLGDG